MPGFYTRAMAQAQCVLTRTRTRNPLYTVLPEDTFGISKVLPDYVVETALHRDGQSSMKIEISHYYSTPTLKNRQTKNCPRHSRHPQRSESCNRREGRNGVVTLKEGDEFVLRPTY